MMGDSVASRPRHLSLFSGVGAIDLGLSAAAGCETVCYVERDSHAASVLVARMEESALDSAPVWDDLSTFDGAAWRGAVDIISAGFPCQPFSSAGKQRGKADDRWLWPIIADTIDAVRPGRVFLENVPGLVKHGLADVLGSLNEMGFDAEWGCFRASEVGASHRRERFFLLADANGESTGRDVAAASGTEERYGRLDEDKRNGFADGVGSAGRARPDTFPPAPDDADGWERWISADGPNPSIRRDADGAAYRVDRLRALGNSAVPQCVAAAYCELSERF